MGEILSEAGQSRIETNQDDRGCVPKESSRIGAPPGNVAGYRLDGSWSSDVIARPKS
jgi:hypothetical protein